ncbi:fibronectin type III domain-containing protein [Limnohabitans radicicola]|uniref:Fibronectin type-III domain-containing protein n=1 Tax=Limnohabitans radicicola TaxID=2771427 RepID=A0A927IJL7_9BURK|nr:hypothetical protein [Limnohabitans radicicola]MBD8050824.1 hypothetical protein [Limnohabitans radicicola]
MRWIRYSALLLSVLVAACGGKGQSAGPPSDLTVQSNGDTQVTLNWTPQSGVQYWVLCAPGDTITSKSWATTVGGNAYSTARDGAGVYNGNVALAGQAVTPPFNVTGLRNDVTYSLTVNARTNGGPGGDAATPVTLKPRLAGVSWSALGSIPSASAIRAMAYGIPTTTTSFVFVAVGDDGAIYSSADNQKTWTARSLPTAAAGRRFNDVTYLFGRFIAIGESGTIVYSPDGVTWTASTINSTSSLSGVNLSAMAASGSTLMAVGQGGTVLTTGDGVTWTAQATNITQNLNAVAISNAVNATLPAVTSVASFWVVVGDGGAVYTSVDGITWTAKNTGLESVTSAWRSVAVLVNTSSILDCGVGSPAVTSISTSYSIALVGDDGKVATAGPTLAWTLSTLDGAPRLNKVISPAGQFVAVGHAGAIYTGNLNADASSISWSRRTGASGMSDLYGVVRYGKDAALAYSNSYIAFGQGGATWYSR